eukprot:m.233550 g.233550  ORF g.233550 m.233550 type:complete len:1824 (-) comp15245_c1_seq14:5044-10515(-)
MPAPAGAARVPSRLPNVQLRNVEGVVPITHVVTNIGSEEGSDVVLRSRTIQPKHARILYDSTRKAFMLQDLGTDLGTFLGSVRVRSLTELTDKAMIRFGSDPKTFRFEINSHLPDLLYNKKTGEFQLTDELQRSSLKQPGRDESDNEEQDKSKYRRHKHSKRHAPSAVKKSRQTLTDPQTYSVRQTFQPPTQSTSGVITTEFSVDASTWNGAMEKAKAAAARSDAQQQRDDKNTPPRHSRRKVAHARSASPSDGEGTRDSRPAHSREQKQQTSMKTADVRGRTTRQHDEPSRSTYQHRQATPSSRSTPVRVNLFEPSPNLTAAVPLGPANGHAYGSIDSDGDAAADSLGEDEIQTRNRGDGVDRERREQHHKSKKLDRPPSGQSGGDTSAKATLRRSRTVSWQSDESDEDRAVAAPQRRSSTTKRHPHPPLSPSGRTTRRKPRRHQTRTPSPERESFSAHARRPVYKYTQSTQSSATNPLRETFTEDGPIHKSRAEGRTTRTSSPILAVSTGQAQSYRSSSAARRTSTAPLNAKQQQRTQVSSQGKGGVAFTVGLAQDAADDIPQSVISTTAHSRQSRRRYRPTTPPSPTLMRPSSRGRGDYSPAPNASAVTTVSQQRLDQCFASTQSIELKTASTLKSLHPLFERLEVEIPRHLHHALSAVAHLGIEDISTSARKQKVTLGQLQRTAGSALSCISAINTALPALERGLDDWLIRKQGDDKHSLSRNDALKGQLAQLTDQVDSLQVQLEDAVASRRTAESALRHYRRSHQEEKESLSATHAAMESERYQLDAEYSELRQQLSALKRSQRQALRAKDEAEDEIAALQQLLKDHDAEKAHLKRALGRAEDAQRILEQDVTETNQRCEEMLAAAQDDKEKMEAYCQTMLARKTTAEYEQKVLQEQVDGLLAQNQQLFAAQTLLNELERAHEQLQAQHQDVLGQLELKEEEVQTQKQHNDALQQAFTRLASGSQAAGTSTSDGMSATCHDDSHTDLLAQLHGLEKQLSELQQHTPMPIRDTPCENTGTQTDQLSSVELNTLENGEAEEDGQTVGSLKASVRTALEDELVVLRTECSTLLDQLHVSQSKHAETLTELNELQRAHQQLEDPSTEIHAVALQAIQDTSTPASLVDVGTSTSTDLVQPTLSVCPQGSLSIDPEQMGAPRLPSSERSCPECEALKQRLEAVVVEKETVLVRCRETEKKLEDLHDNQAALNQAYELLETERTQALHDLEAARALASASKDQVQLLAKEVQAFNHFSFKPLKQDLAALTQAAKDMHTEIRSSTTTAIDHVLSKISSTVSSMVKDHSDAEQRFLDVSAQLDEANAQSALLASRVEELTKQLNEEQQTSSMHVQAMQRVCDEVRSMISTCKVTVDVQTDEEQNQDPIEFLLQMTTALVAKAAGVSHDVQQLQTLESELHSLTLYLQQAAEMDDVDTVRRAPDVPCYHSAAVAVLHDTVTRMTKNSSRRILDAVAEATMQRALTRATQQFHTEYAYDAAYALEQQKAAHKAAVDAFQTQVADLTTHNQELEASYHHVIDDFRKCQRENVALVADLQEKVQNAKASMFIQAEEKECALTELSELKTVHTEALSRISSLVTQLANSSAAVAEREEELQFIKDALQKEKVAAQVAADSEAGVAAARGQTIKELKERVASISTRLETADAECMALSADNQALKEELAEKSSRMKTLEASVREWESSSSQERTAKAFEHTRASLERKTKEVASAKKLIAKLKSDIAQLSAQRALVGVESTQSNALTSRPTSAAVLRSRPTSVKQQGRRFQPSLHNPPELECHSTRRMPRPPSQPRPNHAQLKDLPRKEASEK